MTPWSPALRLLLRAGRTEEGSEDERISLHRLSFEEVMAALPAVDRTKMDPDNEDDSNANAS